MAIKNISWTIQGFLLYSLCSLVASNCGYTKISSSLNCECDSQLTSNCSLQAGPSSIPQIQDATAYGLGFWFRNNNQLPSNIPFFLAAITDSADTYQANQQWLQISNVYSSSSTIGQHQEFYIYSSQTQLNSNMSLSVHKTLEGSVLSTTAWAYVYAEVDLGTNYSAFFISDFNQIDDYTTATLQTVFLGGLGASSTIIIGSWAQGTFNAACGDFRDITFVWMSLKQNPLSLYAFLYNVNELADYQFDQVPLGTSISDYSGSNNSITVTDPDAGSAPYYQTGAEINGLYFSGVDVLNLSIAYTTPAENYDASVTYSMWLKPESQACSPSTIFNRVTSGGSSSILLTFDTVYQTISMQVASSNFNSIAPLIKNVWNRLIISINNYQILIRTNSNPNITILRDLIIPYINWYSGNSTSPLAFSEFIGDAACGFKGYIREFRVFEKSSLTSFGQSNIFSTCYPTCTYYIGDYSDMICLQQAQLQCSSSTIGFPSTQMCLNCNSACKTCYGLLPSQCLSCNQESELYGSQCITMCPRNQYNSNRICLARTIITVDVEQQAVNSPNFTLQFTPKPSLYLNTTIDNYLEVYLNGSLYSHWSLTNITSAGSNSETYLLQLDFSCIQTSSCRRRILLRKLQNANSSYTTISMDFGILNNNPMSQIGISNSTAMSYSVNNSIFTNNSTNSDDPESSASQARLRIIVKAMNACMGILFLSGVILLILSKGKNVTLYHYMSIASILDLFKYFDVDYPTDLALFYQLFEGESFSYPNLFQAASNPNNTTMNALVVTSSEMMQYYGTTYNFFANFGSAFTIILTPLPIWALLVLILKKNCCGTKNDASKKGLIEKLENLRYTFEYNWFISLMISFSARYMFSIILQWKQRGYNETYSVMALIFSTVALPVYLFLIYIQLRAFILSSGGSTWQLRVPVQWKTLTGEYQYSRRAQIVPLLLIIRNMLFAMFIAIPNGNSQTQIIGALIINMAYTSYCLFTKIYWRKLRGRFIKIMELIINFMFIFPIVFHINKSKPYINDSQVITIQWLFLSLVFLIIIVLGAGHCWEATHHIYKLVAKACRQMKELENLRKANELQEDSQCQSSRAMIYSERTANGGVEAGDVEISFDGGPSTGRKLRSVNEIKEQPEEEDQAEDNEADTERHKTYKDIITILSPIKNTYGGQSNRSFNDMMDISADQGDSSLMQLKLLSKGNNPSDAQDKDSPLDNSEQFQQESSIMNLSGLNNSSMQLSKLIVTSANNDRKNQDNAPKKSEFSPGNNLHKDLDEMEEEKSIQIDSSRWRRDSPERKGTAYTEEVESPSLKIKNLLKQLKKPRPEDAEQPQPTKARRTRNYSQSERMQTELTTPGMSRRGSDLFKNMNDQSVAIVNLEEEDEHQDGGNNGAQENKRLDSPAIDSPAIDSPVERLQKMDHSHISLNESFGVHADGQNDFADSQQLSKVQQSVLKNNTLNTSFGLDNNQNKDEVEQGESNGQGEKQASVFTPLQKAEDEDVTEKSNASTKDEIPEWKARESRLNMRKKKSSKIDYQDEDNGGNSNF